MIENKQEICNKLCAALQATSNAGDPYANPLSELLYIEEGDREIVRPIFKDGTGKNGCYDINVSGDSGTAVICDVTRQFVRRMW